MFKRPQRNGRHPDPPPLPDYSDGRAFNPVNVADGNARLIVTLVEGIIHVDSFSTNRARILEFYARAAPIVADYQQQVREAT